MPPGRSDALPTEPVRDLLGIVRALYRAELERKGHPMELEALCAIGKDLAEALELAARCAPDTLGHVAAWAKAERATKALGEMIDAATPLKPAMDAALGRIHAPARPAASSSAAREHRNRRG